MTTTFYLHILNTVEKNLMKVNQLILPVSVQKHLQACFPALCQHTTLQKCKIAQTAISLNCNRQVGNASGIKIQPLVIVGLRIVYQQKKICSVVSYLKKYVASLEEIFLCCLSCLIIPFHIMLFSHALSLDLHNFRMFFASLITNGLCITP